jgi:hypothetical protein
MTTTTSISYAICNGVKYTIVQAEREAVVQPAGENQYLIAHLILAGNSDVQYLSQPSGVAHLILTGNSGVQYLSQLGEIAHLILTSNSDVQYLGRLNDDVI